MKYFASLAFFVFIFWGIPAQADIKGRACIINADMISINGIRYDTKCKDGTNVRLHGIDAPELDQVCRNAEGAIFKCGLYAAAFLLEYIADRELDCRGNSQDMEGNWLLRCYVEGININAYMVSEGWALSYEVLSKRYEPEEAIAKDHKKGIWDFEFTNPWEWREGKRLEGLAEQ
ncbi:MAG: thermonuclease family protein [Rhodospirillales bacterium]|jgi:endonuclease YncB( thermonuclease family)|nr:thermonuclease family protein [Rhodospirillales bacterium]